ncbi:hypothetical protein RFI_14261 [Reticulomyxa filosa]|uniref:Uncharacterized protein n=1 Tax=Reticulomyxa filosa TaxID=46433 RepID=X6NC95_RETFI|nr:hypothetical protein RFI_14261 [Reticulomyxa filosa]|eukprot:ETO22932.1 hypothetical protein RFI_14261 [Reticulomyxa filosa]
MNNPTKEFKLENTSKQNTARKTQTSTSEMVFLGLPTQAKEKFDTKPTTITTPEKDAKTTTKKKTINHKKKKGSNEKLKKEKEKKERLPTMRQNKNVLYDIARDIKKFNLNKKKKKGI